MDDKIKEPAAQPEPVQPKDVKVQPFNSYLKTLMDKNKARGSHLAAIARTPQSCVSRWVKGDLMPTVSQAKALDDFFGSSLVNAYRDQLRPDKKPVEKNAHREEPEKAATLKSEAVPVGSQEEAAAINDFLEGFGLDHNKTSLASLENASLLEGDSVMEILRLVMECLQLILKARPLNRNVD